MNIFFKSIVLFFLCLTVISCSKSDSSVAPLRDYKVQRDTDMTNIEEFMKSHYMTVVNNPGGDDDQDVTFTLIPTGGTQVSIWDQTEYPVQTRFVNVPQGTDQEIVTYKIYYLKLREGSGTNSKSPCNVDKVFAAYHGEYIYKNTDTSTTPETVSYLSKLFQEKKTPIDIDLFTAIRGWSEIFPQFKTGTYSSNTDGTVSYFGFGAGVLFIPSGLAYFSSSTGGIPSYSPLVFSFKLCEIERQDQDVDGIPSYLEDFNTSTVNEAGQVTITTDGPDGYVNILKTGLVNPDDTDGDEKPDFYDIDDDGDKTLTKNEIKNPATGIAFPFDQIPTCGGTSILKKHRDPACF